jgi:hypothetical protein
MRGVNRVASALLGLVLILVGLFVVLVMSLVAAGSSPRWLPLDHTYARLMRTTVGNHAVLITSIVVGVVGLLVLLVELRPWRPDRLLAGRTDTTPWWLSRRSVERRTTTMAQSVPGVSRVRAKARGRPKRWHLRVQAEGLSDKREDVNRAVRDELARLDIDDRTPVEIVLRRPPGRVE